MNQMGLLPPQALRAIHQTLFIPHMESLLSLFGLSLPTNTIQVIFLLSTRSFLEDETHTAGTTNYSLLNP